MEIVVLDTRVSHESAKPTMSNEITDVKECVKNLLILINDAIERCKVMEKRIDEILERQVTV